MKKRLAKEGRCSEDPDNGEFTKPSAGKIIKTFDSLGPDYDVKFEIKVTGKSSGYTNIIFATSASAKKLGKAWDPYILYTLWVGKCGGENFGARFQKWEPGSDFSLL